MRIAITIKNAYFLFVMLMTVLVFTSSVSASPRIKFTHLTDEDGLSSQSIYSIEQDDDGFLWFASQGGLDRYDGYEITHYRAEPSNPNSLADTLVRTIFKDKDNQLWVGTANGLSRYNSTRDDFDNYYSDPSDPTTLLDNEIWSIFQDDIGHLWVGTQTGLHRYKEYENAFERIELKTIGVQIDEIKSIFMDEQGNYWLGTYDNGVYILNKGLGFVSKLNGNNQWDLNIDVDSVYDIKKVELADGIEYWLGTNRGVIQVSEDYTLLPPSVPDNGFANYAVRGIHQQSGTSAIWLATESGVIKYNKLNQQTQIFIHNNADKYSLAHDRNFVVFEDQNNELWFGTENGVSKYSPTVNAFGHYRSTTDIDTDIKLSFDTVDSAVEDSSGNIWITTADAVLNKFEPESGLFTHYELNISERVWSTAVDNQGHIWLKTESHLYRFNTESEQTEYIEINADVLGYAGDAIKPANFIQHVNGAIYIGTNNSQLIIIDVTSLESTLFDLSIADSNKGLASPISEDSLIQPIAKENEFLWLSSEENSLYRYSTISHEIKFIDLSGSNPNAIVRITGVKTSENISLVATLGGGILMYDSDIGKVTRILNVSSGLPHNNVVGIVIDKQNRVWAAATEGLSRVDLEDPRFEVTNYYKEQGLQANEFNEGSMLITRNGYILASGNRGFNYFNPNEIPVSEEIGRPVFTRLLLLNKLAAEVAPQLLSQSLNKTTSLTLENNVFPMTFEFSSPNASFPDLVKYRYKLEGYDQDWIDIYKQNRLATYPKLDSGTYTFKVQSFLGDPNRYAQTKSISLTVLPSPWLSTIALTFYTIITLCVLFWLYRQYQRRRAIQAQIRVSEERLKLSLWGSGDEMWDWNIETGKIFRSNIWGVLEFPQDGQRNLGVKQTNIHKQDLQRVRDALKEHFDGKTDHYESTYRVIDKDGNWVWVLDRGKVVETDQHGKPARMTGTLKDISQIKAAEGRLRLFAKSFENISDAVVIYDSNFRIIEANPSYTRITGISREQALGNPLRFSQYPASYSQQVKKALIQNGTWFGELDEKRANGELFHLELTIDRMKDEQGETSNYVSVFSDITERKSTEAELRKLSNTDTLTNLPNRSYFQAIQDTLVTRKSQHALLVFDLDNFKKINDSLGHQLGDLLLCMVADRLRLLGRSQDTIYRLGGDEFALVMEDTNDIHIITSTAKSILRRINEPYRLNNHEIVVSSSIGIVLFPEDGRSPHELLKNADTAMYHAKNLGGNCYQFFSDSMNKKAVKRLQIENLIRHGLKEDFFSVYYQPKVDIITGELAGMEALVRFTTPKKGLISPGAFIPIAEETGQIIDIGEVVLRKAFFDAKSWLDRGLFSGRVAVNLSAKQFDLPDLCERIDKLLELTDLPSRYVELEITEGTVMDFPQKAIETMHSLRERGIHLALDDFGTGYSSLAYLKQFPLNTLKIDKVFVDDIELSDKGRNMVSTIITIAENLGMSVVAEGVETIEQFEFLKNLECQQMQGYLYSKPVSAADFERLLINQKEHRQETDKEVFNGMPNY